MSDVLERLDTFDVATSTVGTTEALLDDCQEEIQRLRDTVAAYKAAECNDPNLWPVQVENKRQAEEIQRLNEWKEYVRMNSKDAAYYADEALSAPQQEQENE